jgi:hypothetical protein
MLSGVALVAGTHPARAQLGPFGVPHPAAIGGSVGWVLAKQAVFYRTLSTTLRPINIHPIRPNTNPLEAPFRPGNSRLMRVNKNPKIMPFKNESAHGTTAGTSVPTSYLPECCDTAETPEANQSAL